MTVFTDDFERPDGGLANNWVIDNGTATIASGHVSQSNLGRVYNPTINQSGRHECLMTVTVSSIADLYVGPWIKRTSGFSGYVCHASGTLATPTWTLSRVNAGTLATLGAVQGQTIGAGQHTLRLLYSEGYLTFWVDGLYIMQRFDNTHDAGAGAGFRSAGGATVSLDSYTLLAGEETTLTVLPNPIGNYGLPTNVTITGIGTNWTPGTPGSPTFTVDHGLLTDQVVTSATEATATYAPGAFLGTATFLDPSTGATCPVLVTSDPNVVPPGGGQFAPEDVAYIHRSAIAQPDPTILNQDANPWNYNGTETMPDYFRRLWYLMTGSAINQLPITPGTQSLVDIYARIWGGEEWQQLSFSEPGTNSLAKKADDLVANAGTYQTQGTLNLYDVVDKLAFGEGASLSAIELAIGVTGQQEYTSIIDGIAKTRDDISQLSLDQALEWQNLKGDQGLTLESIIDALGNISIGGQYSIDDIYNLLLALKGDDAPNLYSMTGQLNDLAGTLATTWTDLYNLTDHRTHTLQSILTAIGNISPADLTAVLTAISNLRGDDVSTVKGILDKLTEIRGDGATTLKAILDKIQTQTGGTDWTPLGIILLLLLLLLALPEEGAIAIAGGTLAASGWITAIITALPDIVQAIAAVWNWVNKAKDFDPVPLPPCYPGVSRIDAFDAVPFDGGITIEEPMDGAFIHITTPGIAPYMIKNTNPARYARLGVFSFLTDGNEWEAPQPVSWLRTIATPKSITHPQGLVVQCKPGTTGTVTMYRLKNPLPWPLGDITLP